MSTHLGRMLFGEQKPPVTNSTQAKQAIKPGIDTEIIRDLALAIAQISDSRNRGADCFPGTAKHPLGAPSQHPKAAAIRATMHVLTCPDRSQYSAQDTLDVYLQGRQEDRQELGRSTWPMSKQCNPCARATLRHLAAGLDWHWSHGAIRARVCERRQGSGAARASATRSSWDIATSTVLLLSTMTRATEAPVELLATPLSSHSWDKCSEVRGL